MAAASAAEARCPATGGGLAATMAAAAADSRRGASQSDFVPVTSGGPRQLPLANNPTAL